MNDKFAEPTGNRAKNVIPNNILRYRVNSAALKFKSVPNWRTSSHRENA